jgi:hypothetical protein
MRGRCTIVKAGWEGAGTRVWWFASAIDVTNPLL